MPETPSIRRALVANVAPEPCPAPLDLSVVAPAHNEAENIGPLVDEVAAAVRPLGISFEFIVVDDGSTDDTRARAVALMASRPWLRCVAMQDTPPGRGWGQSAAFAAGFRAARGALVATLDADMQNDPADLPAMLALILNPGQGRAPDMVQGDRSASRRDNWVRRFTSRIGRVFRRMILGDTIRDTGCSLRVMRREIALRLPLEFRGVHRFIPASARAMGYTVVEMPVNHRPRHAGTTKYGLGIWQRAWPGLMDCFAVRWMIKRRRPTAADELAAVEAAPNSAQPSPATATTRVRAEEVHA